MDPTTNNLYQYQTQQQYQYQGLQQYQQAIQFALQNPKLGPLQWPGGYHPQHTHTLTYAKIFVGGLKRDTDRKTLMRYFTKFGQVKRVDLVMDPRNPGKNRGFAFVQFEQIDGCERACNRGQFHNIDGHDVEVKRAVLKPPGSGSETAGIGIDPTAYGMMGQYYGVQQQQQTAAAAVPMYQGQIADTTPTSTEPANENSTSEMITTNTNESSSSPDITATAQSSIATAQNLTATAVEPNGDASVANYAYYYQAYPGQAATDQANPNNPQQYAMIQSPGPYGYAYGIATPTSPTAESLGEYAYMYSAPGLSDSSIQQLQATVQAETSPTKASGQQEE